jgi:hypothetical protein
MNAWDLSLIDHSKELGKIHFFCVCTQIRWISSLSAPLGNCLVDLFFHLWVQVFVKPFHFRSKVCLDFIKNVFFHAYRHEQGPDVLVRGEEDRKLSLGGREAVVEQLVLDELAHFLVYHERWHIFFWQGLGIFQKVSQLTFLHLRCSLKMSA